MGYIERDARLYIAESRPAPRVDQQLHVTFNGRRITDFTKPIAPGITMIPDNRSRVGYSLVGEPNLGRFRFISAGRTDRELDWSKFERIILDDGDKIVLLDGTNRKIEVNSAGKQNVTTPYRAESSNRVLARIKLPEMIALSNNRRIMKDEVTDALFIQVMLEYEIPAYHADEIRAIFNDPSQKEKKSFVFVNLYDAREFARRLSEQTGRNFRIQTEAEWLEAREQLSGEKSTWTETPHEGYPGDFVLRRLNTDYRFNCDPESRFGDHAIRLVEDL